MVVRERILFCEREQVAARKKHNHCQSAPVEKTEAHEGTPFRFIMTNPPMQARARQRRGGSREGARQPEVDTSRTGLRPEMSFRCRAVPPEPDASLTAVIGPLPLPGLPRRWASRIGLCTSSVCTSHPAIIAVSEPRPPSPLSPKFPLVKTIWTLLSGPENCLEVPWYSSTTRRGFTAPPQRAVSTRALLQHSTRGLVPGTLRAAQSGAEQCPRGWLGSARFHRGPNRP